MAKENDARGLNLTTAGSINDGSFFCKHTIDYDGDAEL